MAKYWASVVAQKVSGSAIEWAGGVGFTRESGIEKFWRDSKIVSPFLEKDLELTL
jgi:short/branched chain acyl-CoA dehydrogenase